MSSDNSIDYLTKYFYNKTDEEKEKNFIDFKAFFSENIYNSYNLYNNLKNRIISNQNLNNDPILKNKLKSEEIKLRKTLYDIYYSLEGYLNYKYFKKNESDELNIDVLQELEKYLKANKRVFYSMIFWNFFNIMTAKFAMNWFHTNYIFRIIIYLSIIIPNVWFFDKRLKSNRIQMHNIIIFNYLKKEKIISSQNNFSEENKNLISDIYDNSNKSNLSFDAENSEEIEKFLKDYYNNAFYDKFINIKI